MALRAFGRLRVTRRTCGAGNDVITSGTDGGGELRPLGRDAMAAVRLVRMWLRAEVCHGLGMTVDGECVGLLTAAAKMTDTAAIRDCAV